MAFLPVLLFAAGTGLSAAASYSQMQQQAAQAKAQQRMMQAEAAMRERNAKMAEQKSLFDQVRSLKEGQRRVGRMTVGLGKSGFRWDVGAGDELIAEQTYENMLDVALVGMEGMESAAQQRFQGSMASYKARIYGDQSKYFSRAAPIAATNTLLSGFTYGVNNGMFLS